MQSGLRNTVQNNRSGAPGHWPSVALVLGGGGARGLAHIGILEAFDELGVVPKVIAGTSIGAVFGAAYASGLKGADIRRHAVETLTRRYDLLRGVVSKRAMTARSALGLFAGRGWFLDPLAFLDLVVPDDVAQSFGDLEIPLQIVASDYYAMEAKVLTQGELRPAIAASIALPVIFQPVTIDGRLLMDGGFVNPLPFDLVADKADIVVAVDVSGAVRGKEDNGPPSMMETLFSLSFFFERSLVREKLKASQPDIYVQAGTGTYNVLDFFRVKDILQAAEPAKAQFKTQLQRVLSAAALEVQD